MALPSSGSITLDQIRSEFGAPAGTALHDLVRGGAYVPVIANTIGIPSSPPISMQDFYGTSATGDGGGNNSPGHCPHVASFVLDGRRAASVIPGGYLELDKGTGLVTYSRRVMQRCVRVQTVTGVSLVCSVSAPLPILGGYTRARHALGTAVPILRHGLACWDIVCSVEDLGVLPVQHITCENRCYWVGEHRGLYMLHHNAKPPA